MEEGIPGSLAGGTRLVEGGLQGLKPSDPSSRRGGQTVDERVGQIKGWGWASGYASSGGLRFGISRMAVVRA